MMTSAGIGQTDLGVGLVSIKFDDKTVLRFYDKLSDKTPAKTIEFFDDKSINSWNIRDLNENGKWLSPESLWLDYYFFVFRCKSKNPSGFEVIVNNDTGKTFWLKRSTATVFKTWGKYLQGMFAVERSGEFKQKIYANPGVRAREINFKGNDCFEVRSMIGEWIQISTASHCENVITKLNSGWIRWRKGNRLLVSYFPTS
jgi:hypothetical protein